MKLVFSYVVKGIKIKITAKFRASRRLRFDDTRYKENYVTRNVPEKVRDFRETGPCSEKSVSSTFKAVLGLKKKFDCKGFFSIMEKYSDNEKFDLFIPSAVYCLN